MEEEEGTCGDSFGTTGECRSSGKRFAVSRMFGVLRRPAASLAWIFWKAIPPLITATATAASRYSVAWKRRKGHVVILSVPPANADAAWRSSGKRFAASRMFGAL